MSRSRNTSGTEPPEPSRRFQTCGRVTRIHLLPLARLGCALGAVLGVLPGLVCSLTALQVAAGLRRWLENRSAIDMGFLKLNLVELLRLGPLLRALQAPALSSAVFAPALIVSASVLSGLAIAGVILLVGLVYNLLARLTGGVIVELEPLSENKRSGGSAD